MRVVCFDLGHDSPSMLCFLLTLLHGRQVQFRTICDHGKEVSEIGAD